MVCILILVHQDMPKTPLPAFQHLGVALQIPHAAAQQIVEVQGAVFFERDLIGAVGPGHAALPVVRRQFLVAGRGDEAVFGVADRCGHRGGGVFIRIQLQLGQDALEQRPGVAVVVNDEIPGQAEMLRFHAQQAGAQGMEGAHPHPAGVEACHVLHPLSHFIGRLVGEGDGHDVVGLHLLLRHEPGHPADQHPRFAAAGAGDDQDVAVFGCYRSQLLFVQSAENVHKLPLEIVLNWFYILRASPIPCHG